MDAQLEADLVHANDLREQEKYGDSAKAYTDCLIASIEKQDHSALIHCLCGQSHIYKILSRKTGNNIYKNLAVALAKESLAILDDHQEDIDAHTHSIALSSYADSLLMNNQLSEALPYFEESLSVSPAGNPEKGRLKCHIGGIKYLLGDKQLGIDLINEGLSMIRKGDMMAYNIRVWETGALNSLAKIYALEKNPEKAKIFAEESLVIATEHNLTIRKREVEEILEKIKADKTDFSL